MAKKKPRVRRPLILELVEGQLAEGRRLYKEQGDAFQAWQVFAVARGYRKWGIAVPEWVMAYMDRVARELSEISKTEPEADTLASRVTAALEIQRRGAGTVFSRRRETARNDTLVLDYLRLRRGGVGYGAAIGHVATLHNVGRKTAEGLVTAAKKRGRIAVPSNVFALRRDHFPHGVPPGTEIEIHKGPSTGKYRVERTVEQDEQLILVQVVRVLVTAAP